jgi:hypothetical protein
MEVRIKKRQPDWAAGRGLTANRIPQLARRSSTVDYHFACADSLCAVLLLYDVLYMVDDVGSVGRAQGSTSELCDRFTQ